MGATRRPENDSFRFIGGMAAHNDVRRRWRMVY
jgi:hypothetical protein